MNSPIPSKVGTSNLYVTPNDINPAEHDQFIIVDYNGNTPAWDAGIVNQSKDSETINARGRFDCLKIWDQHNSGDGADNKWWVSWVQR